MSYKAYNVLKKNGKATARRYLVASSKKGETKTAFKTRVIKDNARWNRLQRKSGNKADLVEIKSTGTPKKRTSKKCKGFDPFGGVFG